MPATVFAAPAHKAIRKRDSAAAARKLPVHAAFAQPGQILVEAVEMPDGAEFLCIARTLEGPQGAFTERPRRTALLLACDIEFKDEIVYGAALPAAARQRRNRSRHRRRSARPAGSANAPAASPGPSRRSRAARAG